MKNLSNIIKYSIYVGLFFTPFIAFIVPTSMFFPFISGKGFTFRILVEILFGLSIILAFINKEYRPKFSWITKALLVFTLIILVADLLGQNVYKSMWSNYERMEGFVLLAHLTIYYMIVTSVFRTKEIWHKYFNTSIFASLLMSFYGLLQLAGKINISQGGVRLDGAFGNSTYLAIYFVFHIFLCLYMLTTISKSHWSKWVYGGAIILETILLYFTATRGAILGLIGGLLLTGLFLLWKEKENKKLRKVSIWLIVGLFVLIIGFISIRNNSYVKQSPVLSRFATLSLSEFKTQGRYYVWPMAIEGIKERPILGWGQENFNFVFNKNYNPGLFGQEEWFDRTHNLILDWLIAGGILGFLAYVSIYFGLFYYIWRKKSELKLSQKSILTGMVAAYIFHNLFVFDNLISYIIFFSVLGYVHTVGVGGEENNSKYHSKSFSIDAINYVAIPLVVIFTVGTVYYVNIPALSANKTLIKAVSPQNNIEKNLQLFKKTFDYNSFGSSEAIEHLTQTTSQLFSSQSQVSDEMKQKFYDLTSEKIQEKVASTPNDARYLVFAGSFYNRFGQYDLAVDYLKRALIESPKKQSIYFELGTSYLQKGDKQQMLDMFKKAYELKPSALESQIIYATGAIYAKNFEVLKELYALIPMEKVIYDQRFIRAYYDIGDYNTIITIMNSRLEKNPNSLQDLYILADVYFRLGQKEKAVGLIQKMIKLDSSFKEQGELYIKQILAQ